jgi:hypothetical protein
MENDCLRNTMQANNVLNIKTCIILGIIFSVDWNKVSYFCQSVNDNPDAIMLPRCEWQSGHKVHILCHPTSLKVWIGVEEYRKVSNDLL